MHPKPVSRPDALICMRASIDIKKPAGLIVIRFSTAYSGFSL
jgi:hypothetical protein